MLTRRLSIFLFLASYLLLFFALWYYASCWLAPWHSRYLWPLDLAVFPRQEWSEYWFSYFMYGIGSYLFAGLSLLFGLREIFASYRERSYFRLWLNNMALVILLIASFYANHILYLFIIPRGLHRSYAPAVFPLIAYLLSMKLWLKWQSRILESTNKAKRVDAKAKNDLT